jgi:hypothetical protein
MNQNGTWGSPQPLQIGSQCIGGFSPAWNPFPDDSGAHIVAFDHDASLHIVKFKQDINGWVYDVEPPTVIYDSPINTISLIQPTWSPDGSKLAFVEYNDQPGQPIFYVVVIDLTDPQLVPLRLVNNLPGSPLEDFWLNEISWAKQNDLLVVSGGALGLNKDLWCINVNDTTQTINLTAQFDQQQNLNDDDPSWGPTDSEIIFSRGGVAMSLTIETAHGNCPTSLDTATLRQVAKAKGKNSLWGFDWRRGAQ